MENQNSSQQKTKKRKVSKKTKKSWRKFVDTKDVDSFLEDQRLEERLGTPFHLRKEEELFYVDVSPDQKLLTSRSEKQLTAAKKEPKCFELLKPLTAVPDPITKRNRVRTREERRHPIAKSKELKRKLNNQLKLKERLALINKAIEQERRKNKYKRGDFTSDIWSDEKDPAPDLNQEWLSNNIVRHTLNNIGKKIKNKANITQKKPSILPAIELPHPGTSYNPSYHDHQKLLADVFDLEEKYQKNEQHLRRTTSQMFKKVTIKDREKDYLNEMSQGLNLNENDENNEASEEDSTDKFINPPVKNKKKTLKARRKQMEQKKLAQELAKKKLEKKKIVDVHNLENHKRAINMIEKKVEFLRSLRENLKKKKDLEPKNISRVKYEPADPDYLLSDELSGNLRGSSTCGNLLRDRYKSLQQRNIVAPAKLILKRSKAKVKKIIKSDHKIDLQAEMKKYSK